MTIDYMDLMDRGRPPATPERKAAMKRVFDRCAAFAKEHPDRVPYLPHYRHTCLNPETCTTPHDPYPIHP